MTPACISNVFERQRKQGVPYVIVDRWENRTSLRTAGRFGEDKQKGRKPSAVQSRQNRF